MLANAFKTPQKLGLKQEQFDALVTTLVLMETRKLTHYIGEMKSYHLEDNLRLGKGRYAIKKRG